MTKRYVALGSSMAAGPGIKPRAAGSPFAAGRSARNYPHLVAEQLGYDLVDVTCSGATTANVLRDRQHGVPPQVEALDGAEDLVTVTIGGNDASPAGNAATGSSTESCIVEYTVEIWDNPSKTKMLEAAVKGEKKVILFGFESALVGAVNNSAEHLIAFLKDGKTEF